MRYLSIVILSLLLFSCNGGPNTTPGGSIFEVDGVQKKKVEGFGGVIAEKSSAPVKNRAHTIETQIDLKGDEEGVFVACGGMTGGYTMFIRGNRLYYDYNFLDGVHCVLKSLRLPEGKIDLQFNFIRTKEFGGNGELYVNGGKADEVEMPQMHISTYSLAETFDIGYDMETQVSDLYRGILKFKGDLDRVIFTVSDEHPVPSRKLPAVYY